MRVRGGNKKYRALRLDVGNFSWGSECKYIIGVMRLKCVSTAVAVCRTANG